MRKAKITVDQSPDDGVRGSCGVVVSIGEHPPRVRVVFDDARPSRGPNEWQTTRLFTSFDVPDWEDLQNLSEKQLAEIGRALVSRLGALHRAVPGTSGTTV